MLRFVKSVLAFGVLFLVSFALAAVGVPALLTSVEKITLSPLSYENALRIYMVVAWLFMLVGSYWYISKWNDRRQQVIFLIFAVALASLAYVFWADPDTRILEEQNWIRYVTAGALYLASLTSFIVAVYYLRVWRESKALPWFWALFGVAYAFAGSDELFQIHEAIGGFIGSHTSLGAAAADYMTLGYAVVALAVVIFLLRTFFKEYRMRHQTFSATMVVGGVTYIASTLFDTFDVYGERLIKKVGVILSQDPRFVFSDLWYVIWAPHNLFNGIEEVFEYAAATAFFAATLILFLEKRFPLFSHVGIPQTPKRRTHPAVGLVGLIVVYSLVAGIAYANAPSPLLDSSPSWSRVAGPQDKLRHSDDVFYHPAWGVLVGNEGRGTIEVYDGTSVATLPDPERLVHDPDSLTASTSTIYVSDGGAGKIIAYTKEGGYKVLYSRDDGLKHPEALVYYGGALYVTDESTKTITKIDENGTFTEWRPSHPLWRAPEGIAYDSKTGTLLVTDDMSGAIFRSRFESTFDYLSGINEAEGIKALSDGSAVVTDNGWGSIVRIQPDGAADTRARFRRMYRDVQGIGVDESKNIYVITADGFNSVSFMPSYLWKIEGIL
ncbi:hypothetical protein HY622_01330 [Candidatus Uhrbacteria bacterium]|nr:hypothetical protein [Candidatus Uhrbacteria bacterium]